MHGGVRHHPDRGLRVVGRQILGMGEGDALGGGGLFIVQIIKTGPFEAGPLLAILGIIAGVRFAVPRIARTAGSIRILTLELSQQELFQSGAATAQAGR